MQSCQYLRLLDLYESIAEIKTLCEFSLAIYQLSAIFPSLPPWLPPQYGEDKEDIFSWQKIRRNFFAGMEMGWQD
jgi:hypothetical protein